MATRDYKSRERINPHRGRRGNSSGFFWFVTGAVLGGFGVGLAWMLQDRSPPTSVPNPQNVAKAQQTKPRFDFHQILPEMEVLVPDEELSTAALPPPKPPTPPPKQQQEARTEPEKPPQAADGTSYLVQIASFRQSSDAERLKAKLALLGIHAGIQQVTVNGKAYHRVRAGPYKGKQDVNKTRALLRSKGLDSIAIKLK